MSTVRPKRSVTGETALGDFRGGSATIAERLDRKVTAADVARAVRTYLVPARRTIVIREPESGRRR